MTGTSDPSRRSLWTALAASLVIHAGAGLVGASDFDAVPFVPLVSPMLSVRIANAAAPEPPTPAPPSEMPSIERVVSPAEPAHASPATPNRRDRMPDMDTADPAPAPATASANVQPIARQLTGAVNVVADPTLGRVGWFLESRSRTEFPVEVKEPVRIGEPLHFDYPADALLNRREGAVLAWLMVDANGSVVELNIISGDDDFSVAVADALAAAHFLPATDLYDKPIPFYAVLEFDFRIDGVGAVDAHDSAVSVTPPQ